ncbi:hypothetical protein L6R52_37090 [Myxococcota bacterium]|nr:hypothetical protein [Myxococcota bacterium]
MKTFRRVSVALVLLAPACMRAKDEAPAQAKMAEEAANFAEPSAPAAEGLAGGGEAFDDAKVAKKTMMRAKGDFGRGGPAGAASAEAEREEGGGGEPSAPARAWFPETFLFQPLVPTDETGRAKVEVLVPDRLTTWRVLALAHSRDGAQAGAEASFLGTLPV